MTTSANRSGPVRPRAVSASVDHERLTVELDDGRQLRVPLGWFDWLQGATDIELHDFQIIEGGAGIWWETIDEGISVPWLFGLPEFPLRPKSDSYRVAYVNDGRKWIAEIPDLDSSTWARTLPAAKREARWLIAELLGVNDLDEAGINVVDEINSAETAGVGTGA